MSEPKSPRPSREPQRIAKLLARAGIASRREIERMIAEGRIAIDGKVLATPATVIPSLRGVTVDGKPVAQPAPARLFLFHKPPGVLTTERDPKGRRTIYDVLPKDLPRLMPVGRLDMNTEGLLLMTSDGELKRELELPATGVERSYRARAFGPISQAQLEALSEGVEIEGVRYGSIDANLERRTGANSWIELTLTEGKNREVRRVLEYLGVEVNRLIRTRYGPFVLADLPPGEIGEVRQHDLVAFRKTLKLPAAQRHYQPVTARAAPKPEPEAEATEAPARPVRGTRPEGRQAARAQDGAVAKPARAARARVHREARGEEARPQRAAPAARGSDGNVRTPGARGALRGERVNEPKRGERANGPKRAERATGPKRRDGDAPAPSARSGPRQDGPRGAARPARPRGGDRPGRPTRPKGPRA